ncbi:MAG: hypothetical protein WA476_13465 [Acidobacteriaceae bacterium]
MDDRGIEAETKTVEKNRGSVAARILGVPVGLFFWFGDRALREIWHFSFFASLMIWAGALGAVVIGGVIWAHLRNG